jgi:predicted ATPase
MVQQIRSAVLVTGMSGTGKSTVLAELARHGHETVDTDDPGWIVEVDTPQGPEPMWDLDRCSRLHRTPATSGTKSDSRPPAHASEDADR